MPPKGGKRAKRGKKTPTVEGNKYTQFAVEGQTYAVVTSMLGDRRFMAKCKDEKERLIHIPGKFKGRRNWISVGMVVLINIRDYQDDKSDVSLIYTPQDVKRLQRAKELGDLLGNEEEEDNCGFVFAGSEDESEKSDEINIDDL